MSRTFEPGGVSLFPIPAKTGELVTIGYQGLLADSGAEKIYLHTGYGANWQNQKTLPMQKISSGWERTLEVDQVDQLNFCFKDGADNWDNNSGRNWRISVE